MSGRLDEDDLLRSEARLSQTERLTRTPGRPAVDTARARLAARPQIEWHGIPKGEVPPPLADAIFTGLAIGRHLVSADRAAAAQPDLAVTDEVVVLSAARARDEAIRLADAGDFDGAQRLIAEADAQLRHAGMDAEADALDAKMLGTDAYGPAVRKRLRYDSSARRRRRDT